MQIISGPHDDVQPGFPRDPGQRFRVASNTLAGGIDDRRTAFGCEQHQFAHGQRFVIQSAVLQIGEWVVPQLRQDFRGDRHVADGRGERRLMPTPPAGTIVENMFVHQGDAEPVTRDRAKDGHYAGFEGECHVADPDVAAVS